MNELTRIESVGHGQRITSREIAEVTGKRHDHVMRDIKNLIEQRAINAPSFGEVEYLDAKGEKRPMYNLDFQASMTLVTGYNAVLRSRVVARWMELEQEKALSSFHIPETLPGALRLAADLADKNEELQKQIEADAPKVELATAISESDKLISFDHYAKIISDQEGFVIGEKNLFSLCRAIKLIDYQNMPYQQYLDLGWFKVVEPTYRHEASNGYRPYKKTMITGIGQVSILSKIKRCGRLHEFLNKGARANRSFMQPKATA